MTTTVKSRNSMYHCDDCSITVHENDRENHINGCRHKYKVRQKLNETKHVESTLECSICNSKFTNIGFYTIHIGSKTHKRNLRRIRKSVHSKKATNNTGGDLITDGTFRPTARRAPIQGMDKYLSLDDVKEPCDYTSTREKYRTRNIKNQEGHNRSYISSVTAYWAVTLAFDPTIQDFKICINDKDWGDFGDAVIEIQLKETTDHSSIITTFAIQFKHISNNVKGIDSLSEGRFNFVKYISQILKIKGRNDIENKKFVLFTTASAEPELKHSLELNTDILHRSIKECPCNGDDKEVPVVAKTLSNRRKILVNTSDDNENIYFFFSTDDVHSLPKLYLYTRQKKLKNFARSIDNTVNDRIDNKWVEIHRDFVKYIENWSDGFLGGNYRLKKEDILVKLGHLFLYEFRVPPQVRVTKNWNYAIWNQAVSSVDVTILTKHPIIIFKVCTPINLKIESELGLKIDTTTSTLKVTPDNINKIQNSVLKMYLFEETLGGDMHDDLPLEIIYDVFWKAGLTPMILEVKNEKDQDHVLQVISLLKTLGLTRRYFLKTSEPNIKASLKYYKMLTFFVNLDDVAHKLPSFLLDYVQISVTDTFSISLKKIQDFDLFFQKGISTTEFLDMSLGLYSLKPVNSHLARREQGVEDVKLVLNNSMMNKIKKEMESKDDTQTVTMKNMNVGKRCLHGINPEIFY